MDVLMRQTAIGFSLRTSIVVGRSIPATQILSSGFCDQAHLRYYTSNPAPSKLMGMKTRISGKQQKATKDNEAPKKLKKKKKKQLKLEASELVLEQLQKLKAEQKDLKKKMKQEEVRLKADDSEMSSSSSSESSDSECGGEIIDMNSFNRTHESKQKKQVFQEEKTTSTSPIQIMQTITSSQPNIVLENMTNGSMVWKKIEVCMGGKCKKSGGSALLEKLKRVIGIEGAVSECKCMGKCRDGPNLKVLNYQFDEEADSVPTTPSNWLCIGVGLEDVDMIVSNFHSC